MYLYSIANWCASYNVRNYIVRKFDVRKKWLIVQLFVFLFKTGLVYKD